MDHYSRHVSGGARTGHGVPKACHPNALTNTWPLLHRRGSCISFATAKTIHFLRPRAIPMKLERWASGVISVVPGEQDTWWVLIAEKNTRDKSIGGEFPRSPRVCVMSIELAQRGTRSRQALVIQRNLSH